jgi:hypothetical protein
MLMGDLLAYLDIFTMIFLLGILSRASTILFVMKQAAAALARLARGVLARMQRIDVRHRRQASSAARKRLVSRSGGDDEESTAAFGLACA